MHPLAIATIGMALAILGIICIREGYEEAAEILIIPTAISAVVMFVAVATYDFRPKETHTTLFEIRCSYNEETEKVNCDIKEGAN